MILVGVPDNMKYLITCVVQSTDVMGDRNCQTVYMLCHAGSVCSRYVGNMMTNVAIAPSHLATLVNPVGMRDSWRSMPASCTGCIVGEFVVAGAVARLTDIWF